MTKHQTQLTSSEIASIWTGYMNDSMSKCILSYFLKQIEDEDIRPVIQFAYDISFKHLKNLRIFSIKKNYPFQQLSLWDMMLI